MDDTDLLDIDPLTGAISTMDYDETNGSLLIKRTVNVQGVLDANEMVRNDPTKPWRGADGSMWHVASVPLDVLQGWLNEFNLARGPADKVRSYLDPSDEWQSFMWRRLSSSDYYKFKTAPVRL